MGSNKRKVCGEGEGEADHGEAGAKPCPRCGCRHRYTVRASAGPKTVKITSVCRFCGFETVESA